MGGPSYHTIAKWIYFPRSMSNAEKTSVAFSESIGRAGFLNSENATVLDQEVR